MDTENAINQLKHTIEKFCGPVPAQDWEKFSAKLECIKRPKGYELLSQGGQAKNLWYLVKGAVRNFETESGLEKTYRFFVEGDFFINFHSIITNSPSDYSYVCEEDCELISLPYTSLLEAYEQSHYFERAGRIFAELAMISELKYRRMFLNMNATQRYKHLMALKPNIFHRFMLKHIASMLGITPVSLSRLRNTMNLHNKNKNTR
jgi:CRP-like cAMP-binding protein